MSAAILRIGATLDFDTVLREVVESARALTGAAYGVIATVGEAGQPLDFVTSGFTPQEHRAIEEWPDGLQLFELLRDLEAPLRLPDLNSWIHTLGCSPFPISGGSFQATPMRHRGTAIGGFFLGGKEEAFTDTDEELLVLFAAQAASAIANARAHCEEQRARADLEALIETSPIGVVVFEAATGKVRSLNREARRIQAQLGTTGGSVEALRQAVVCRRGDGREGTLRDLCDAETLRGEEVNISAPDGKSIRTLIHATPVHSEDGAVERIVVTLQDLAPFEALEHSRAEFLELVSHELRAPLAAIKGSATTALESSYDPSRTELRQFLRITGEQADRMNGLISDLLDAGRIRAGMLPVEPAPEDLAGLIEQARIAFTNSGGQHAVIVHLSEDLPRVMADSRRIVQVLNNLLSNAARHSPAITPIQVAAVRTGEEVQVSVTDTGEGVAPERLPHLFRRHVDTVGREGGSSGLGLIICKGLVEAHGGRIRAESAGLGQGTCITFTLPASETESQATAAPSPKSGRGQETIPILVVDDDPHALCQAREALTGAGYAPATTSEPSELARLIETEEPALVVLDLVLPGTDGIELMQALPALSDLPVIFISAYGSGDTIARALEAGAADYLVKPFSSAELVARVRLALRHRTTQGPFRIGDLVIDRAKRRVTLANQPLRLTAIEYKLLHTLSLDAGGVTTYESLQRRVWKEGRGSPQAVRSAIRKLRRKLGDDARKPKYILGERGLGYRMPEPDEP